MSEPRASRKHPQKGRAKITLLDAALSKETTRLIDELLKACHNLKPHFASGADGEQRLAKLTQPDLQANAGGRKFLTCESAALPAFRLQLAGSRQIIMFPFSQIGDYVREQVGGRALKHPINSVATQQWLMNASSNDIAQLMEARPKCDALVATVGSGDGMYTPAGWLRVEKTATDDSIGLRVTVVPTTISARSLSELEVAAADYTVTGKKNLALDWTIEKLRGNLKPRPQIPALVPSPTTPVGETPTPTVVDSLAPKQMDSVDGAVGDGVNLDKLATPAVEEAAKTSADGGGVNLDKIAPTAVEEAAKTSAPGTGVNLDKLAPPAVVEAAETKAE